jgi:hypothetical protein
MYPDSPWKKCPDCTRYPDTGCDLCQGEGVVWYTVMPTEGDE